MTSKERVLRVVNPGTLRVPAGQILETVTFPKGWLEQQIEAAIDAAVCENTAMLRRAMDKQAEQLNEAGRAAVVEERERIAALAEEVEATYETCDYEDAEAKAKGGYASSCHCFAELIRGGRNANPQPPV